jgi:hypothetical protein
MCSRTQFLYEQNPPVQQQPSPLVLTRFARERYSANHRKVDWFGPERTAPLFPLGCQSVLREQSLSLRRSRESQGAKRVDPLVFEPGRRASQRPQVTPVWLKELEQ